MTKRLLLPIVSLALSIALMPVPAVAQSPGQPQNQTKKTDKKATDDLRGTDSSPFTVKVLPTPKIPEDAAEAKQARQDQSAANWAMVKLTLVLCAIGVIQALVFSLQARRLRQTVDKMDEIARVQTDDTKKSIAEATRAATAMDKSAKAAEENIRLATKELILLNRAYLSVDTWIGDFDDGKVRIRFRVFNPSHTAARIETLEFGIVNRAQIKQTSGVMLTPNESRWFFIPQELIPAGSLIVIKGRIAYTDIFHKERHRRFSKTCRVFSGACSFEDHEGVGLNDEEEWDQDQDERI